MCDPVSISMAVASIGSQAIASNQTKQYQKRQFNATKEAADANALRNYVSVQQRQEQESQRSSEAIQGAVKETTAAAATSRVSALESGVAGNSSDALTQDFLRTEGDFRSRTIQSQAYLDAQFSDQLEGIRAGQTAQINSGVGGQLPGIDFINPIIRSYSSHLQLGQARDRSVPGQGDDGGN